MEWVTDMVPNEMYSQDKSLYFCVVVFFHPEGAAYFLYNLIDSMSEEEVQAQEDKLRKYLNQLHAQVQAPDHNVSCCKPVFVLSAGIIYSFDTDYLPQDHLLPVLH